MKRFFKKLIFGKNPSAEISARSVIDKRIHNIRSIWNNEQEEDIGIEKLLRLFLGFSQFLFPGIYIKHFIGGRRLLYQEITVDLYVLFKIAFAFGIIYNGRQDNDILVWIVIFFMAETLLHIPTLIFASDIFSRPRSYRRSMLLLFFNYIEIVLAFAVLYSSGDYLNQAFKHWFDPIYFSFISGATVGFGDFYPITPIGKMLVSFQVVIFIIFAALFLNFFSNKVESKGYFDHTREL
jgi:hypothetical protein